MKRSIAMLILAAMALCLCACGGAKPGNQTAAEPAASSVERSADTTGQTLEPEKAYTSVTKKLLVREIRRGEPKPNATAYVRLGSIFDRITEYSYDEFGERTGETVSYVYPEDNTPTEEMGLEGFQSEIDDAGRLARVSWNGDNIFGNQLINSVEYENGKLVRSASSLESTGEPVEETVYVYGQDGQVTRETTSRYIDLYDFGGRYEQPVSDAYEYDGEGRCVRWEHSEKGVDTTVTCVFDGSGNITETEIDRGENGVSHYDRRFNEQNQLVGVTRTFPSGDVVEYSYSYDGSGKPLSEEVEIQGKHIRIDFSYDEQGYLSRAEWFLEGEPFTVTEYVYEKDDYGYVTGSIVSGTSGPDPFSYSGSTVAAPDSTDNDGGPYWTDEYELGVFGVDPCYMKRTTSYEYENRSVKAEAAPAAA